MSQALNLSAIVAAPQCQPRAQMDMALALEYAGEMQAGTEFPPIVAFGTPERCWVADGFHRFEAAKLSNFTVMQVDLREGGLREAQLHAVGANVSHGLRRSNADKHRAVRMMLEDEEWGLWSDREIARQCAVSAPLVGNMRAELGLVNEVRTVKRGDAVYTMQTDGIGRDDDGAEMKGIDPRQSTFMDEVPATPVVPQPIPASDPEPVAERVPMPAVPAPQKAETPASIQSVSVPQSVPSPISTPMPASVPTTPTPTPPPQPRLPPQSKKPSVPMPVKVEVVDKKPLAAVLVARVMEERVTVSMGEEGALPRVMRGGQPGDLRELLNQVVTEYFNEPIQMMEE